MAMATYKAPCSICNKGKNTYRCEGCLQKFCFTHLTDHRQIINKQLDEIENDRDLFLQTFLEQKNNLEACPWLQEIDKWVEDSITKIKQTAEECKQILIRCTNKYLIKLEKKIVFLTEELQKTRQENEFNENDLNQLSERLKKFKEELDRPPYVSVEQDPKSFINKIYVIAPLDSDTKWKQYGITVAGGNSEGNKLNQFYCPRGIYTDDDQTIYIADFGNHRIIEWKSNAKNGQIVAGGHGQGNQTNQLSRPSDVIIDKENNSFIISDYGNRRVMQWSRQNHTKGQIRISNIQCCGLILDNNGYLYVSDYEKHEVRRWKIGDKTGRIVAGGNGKGDHLNQLNSPTFIFIDENYSLYISDSKNHRVMKWIKGAKEGIVVAGGNGQGNSLTQLFYPCGVIVDQFDQIYVADYRNDRVMRWCEGSTEGTVVVGGNGEGNQLNQLNGPSGLSFDRQGNLYVADWINHRIQKFEMD